jgi:hypothetical protein
MVRTSAKMGYLIVVVRSDVGHPPIAEVMRRHGLAPAP